MFLSFFFQAAKVDGIPEEVKVVQTACGHAHSVAVLADGRVLTWGDDRNLQLGLRDTSIRCA